MGSFIRRKRRGINAELSLLLGGTFHDCINIFNWNSLFIYICTFTRLN